MMSEQNVYKVIKTCRPLLFGIFSTLTNSQNMLLLSVDMTKNCESSSVFLQLDNGLCN